MSIIRFCTCSVYVNISINAIFNAMLLNVTCLHTYYNYTYMNSVCSGGEWVGGRVCKPCHQDGLIWFQFLPYPRARLGGIGCQNF